MPIRQAGHPLMISISFGTGTGTNVVVFVIVPYVLGGAEGIIGWLMITLFG